ncbi:MAG TPA: hypothetical protein VGK54_06910 [Chloroflexota bacterium]|jgi:plastocyanin
MHVRALQVLVAIGTLAIAAFPVGVSQAADPITIAVGLQSADMAIQDVRVVPNVVHIRVGDTVTWEARSHLPAVIGFLSGEPRMGAGATIRWHVGTDAPAFSHLPAGR